MSVDSRDEGALKNHLTSLERFSNAPPGWYTVCPLLDLTCSRHICTTDVGQLEPVHLSELSFDTGAVNQGKILWVTTVQPSFRSTELQALGKDGEGRLVTILLRNFLPSHATSSDAQALIPVKTRLGIKEPYCISRSDGNRVIQIYNLCNVIIELPKMDTDDANVLKEEGNRLFKAKRYEQAAELYSDALSQTADASLRLVLYLNRAAARIGQRLHSEYKNALDDCDNALAIDSACTKAKYRKGQALFGLRRYDEAEAVYAEMIKDAKNKGMPTEEAWEIQLVKTKTAIECSTNGKYDLMKFPFDPEKQLQTDVAEYFGSIAVQMSKNPGMGRGLFLTKNVKAGEILLVERAQATCARDPKKVVQVHMNREIDPSKVRPHLIGLMEDLVILATKDTRANALLSFLSMGKEVGESSLPILDIDMLRPGGQDPPPAPQLSAYSIYLIAKTNSFVVMDSSIPSTAGRRTLIERMKDPRKYRSFGSDENFKYVPVTQLMRILDSAPFSRSMFDSVLSATSQAELNKSDANGFTALHVAALKANEYAFEALLQAGANPHAKTRWGAAPMHIVVVNVGAIKMTRALLKHGAAIDEPMNGVPPLLTAVFMRNAELVKFMLQSGANPYFAYRANSAAADAAIALGDERVINAFKEAGYDLATYQQTAGLWIVASFMNHVTEPNTEHFFVGNMMFVIASDNMQAGTELTTCYGEGEKLGNWF